MRLSKLKFKGGETALLKRKLKTYRVGKYRIYKVETLRGKTIWIISNYDIAMQLWNIRRVTDYVFVDII